MTTQAPQRWTATDVCLACGGWPGLPRGQGVRCEGYLTSTGKSFYCTREEHAGALPLDQSKEPAAYLHMLHGKCGCGAGEGYTPDHSGHIKGQRRSEPPRGRVETRYPYRDERGELLFEVERWFPKDFRQRSPDPKAASGWTYSTKGVRKVPFRLPELLGDPPSPKGILIVEGEEDVNAARDRLGIPATCNPGGAGKWSAAMMQILADRGRIPVILPDHDDLDAKGRRAGQDGAEKTARLAHELGLRPRMLAPFGDGGGYDLRDWIRDGGTREQLLELIKAAPVWTPLEALTGSNILSLPHMDGGGGGENRENGYHHGPNGLPSFTDTRNAERLVDLCGEVVRKDHTRGGSSVLKGWRLWDGVRWALDETQQVMAKAKAVVKKLPDEVPQGLNSEVQGGLWRAALACESTNRLHALLDNAGHLLPASHETWDQNPYLLNCQNGTLDLRTGDLLAHQPDRYQSKLAPVDYDPAMPTPVWDAFLERVFAGDAELVAFVQRGIGMSLVGAVLEHVLFVMFGRGGNGKGTFIKVWLNLLGEYAREGALDLFTETKYPQHPTSIAELNGVRFVATGEGPQQRFDERVVKMLTGGDVRNARFMHQDAFTYTPSDTFWLATNHEPNVSQISEGIKRRLKMVPFMVRIPDAEMDKDLDEKLRAEYPGILAWAVRGCLEWQAHGLGRAAAVDVATATYWSDMDSFQGFIDECCVLEQPGVPLMAASEALYKAYQAWAEKVGEKPAGQKWFGLRLRERGFERVRVGRRNLWHWRGLGLRSDGDLFDGPDGPGSGDPAPPESFLPVDNPSEPSLFDANASMRADHANRSSANTQTPSDQNYPQIDAIERMRADEPEKRHWDAHARTPVYNSVTSTTRADTREADKAFSGSRVRIEYEEPAESARIEPDTASQPTTPDEAHKACPNCSAIGWMDPTHGLCRSCMRRARNLAEGFLGPGQWKGVEDRLLAVARVLWDERQ